MKSKIIGFLILITIITGGLIAYQFNTGKQSSAAKNKVTLKGLAGGEKIGFLEDTNVKSILADNYGISLDYSKAGSIEMVQGDTSKYDFLFPSSETALQIFKDTKGQQMVKSQIIFNSPMVFYSWDNVTDALIKNGIVKQQNNSYYIADMPKLIDLITQGKKWSDIGLSDLYGSISVISTDPTKSNSGNMFAGLLGNMLNNGEVLDEGSTDKILPKLKQFFDRLGYMQSSSSDLFDQYLKTGAGAKPIIVGYENQIIEFADQNPEAWKTVKNKVRILYPVPTIWSAHPVIALNSKSTNLITALTDSRIQQSAWEKHGFRTGIAGVQNNMKAVTVDGIPENIDKVIPLPNPTVMEKIISSLSQK